MRSAPEPETVQPEKEQPVKEEAKDNRPLESADRPPVVGQQPQSHPSGPTLESERKLKRTTSSKPSVKQELREIKAARKAQEAGTPRRDAPAVEKPQARPETTHKQPQRGKLKIRTRESR